MRVTLFSTTGCMFFSQGLFLSMGSSQARRNADGSFARPHPGCSPARILASSLQDLQQDPFGWTVWPPVSWSRVRLKRTNLHDNNFGKLEPTGVYLFLGRRSDAVCLAIRAATRITIKVTRP